MLALRPASTPPPPTLQPHLLPATIHHNGPITYEPRHWTPTPSASTTPPTSTSYFRGRRLQGRVLTLPDTHTGLVAQAHGTATIEPARRGGASRAAGARGEHDQRPESGDRVPARELLPVATFERLTVWRHGEAGEGEEGAEVEGQNDVHVRAVTEWMGFAAAVSSAVSGSTLLCVARNAQCVADELGADARVRRKRDVSGCR